MKELEYAVQQDLYLIGTVEEIDESFSHEFGVEPRVAIEVKNLTLHLWINGCEWEITSAFRDSDCESKRAQWAHYEEVFLEFAQKRFEAAS